jgi:hypothetical protein
MKYIFVDLTNRRYGKLVVQGISRKEIIKNRNRIYWNCLCDCGGTAEVLTNDLISGHTKSCRCLTKIEYGKASFNYLYKSYQIKATKRNLEFNLSKEEFLYLTKQNCFYDGVEPHQIIKTRNNGDYVYNGIDRIDSSKGYTIDNCVPCCGRCNEAKMAETQEDFYAWIDRVHAHIHRNDPIDVTTEMMQNQNSNISVSI